MDTVTESSMAIAMAVSTQHNLTHTAHPIVHSAKQRPASQSVAGTPKSSTIE